MSENIRIYGVPLDLGANLRGVDMGPSALRIAGIGDSLRRMGFDVCNEDLADVRSRITFKRDDSDAKYLGPITEICQRLADLAAESLEAKALPVFLGGDHSLAMGTISGVSNWYRDRGEKIGAIWFDAHTDMNTPDTSPSGNIHGMPLAALLGHGPPELTEIGGGKPKLDPNKVVVVGARDVDRHERGLVHQSGITVFSMSEIAELGMAEVTRRAIKIATEGTAGIHLSFDIDGLDPEVAPGVGTPVRGGINYREAHLFMELISMTGKLIGLDIVELNPVRDNGNETAQAVVHLVQSLFGRTIL